MKLSEDLTHAVSMPRELWYASDYKENVRMKKDEKAYVTDGAFLFRSAKGELFCI